MRNLKFGLIGAFLVGLAVGPAFGAINTYTTLSSWNAAVTSPVTINFNNVSGYPALYTDQSVTFTPLVVGYLLQQGYPAYWAGCDVQCLSTGDSGANHSIVATHPGGILAFGLNLFTSSLGLQPVTVRTFAVGNGTSTPDREDSIDSDRAAPAFYGLTSSVAIARVEIVASGNNYAVIDNYALATALAQVNGDPPPTGETPEVPTLGYFGIGCLAMLYGWRRRPSR